jgi:ATP-binding cassette, subfamily B, bacterial
MVGRLPSALLAGLLRPQVGRLGFVLAASAAASGLGLAQPWLTKLLIDEGLTARRMDVVAWYAVALLASAGLGAAIGAANRWAYLTLSGQMLFALRERVFAHLQRLPPSFFGRRGTGDILARLDGDVAEVQRFAVDSLLAAVNALLVLAGTVAAMALLCPRLLLPAFVLLPLQVGWMRHMRPKIAALTRRLREQNGELTAFFVENIMAMKLVQAVGAETREANRLAALNRSYLGQLRRTEMLGFAAASLPTLLNGVAAAAIFLIGGFLMIRGELTLGALIAFTVYLGRAGGPVNTLLGLLLAQRRARVSFERIAEILEERPAVLAPAEPVGLPPQARGEIVIQGVRFAYPGQAPLFDRLDAVIPAASKLGIVGVSGVGKSTLIDLLHRHYDPDSGCILLDGIDLRRLDPAELRRRVAVVAQDSPLVTGSIAANIRYAAPDASDEQVMRAAVAAEIAHLGLDTPVAERGISLSGGERQRLAIARALLQDPLVLVLDEATSAVDREAERRIAAAIDRLFGDRTRIVISHHPDVLADAGRILELTSGGLVDRRVVRQAHHEEKQRPHPELVGIAAERIRSADNDEGRLEA